VASSSVAYQSNGVVGSVFDSVFTYFYIVAEIGGKTTHTSMPWFQS